QLRVPPLRSSLLPARPPAGPRANPDPWAGAVPVSCSLPSSAAALTVYTERRRRALLRISSVIFWVSPFLTDHSGFTGALSIRPSGGPPSAGRGRQGTSAPPFP